MHNSITCLPGWGFSSHVFTPLKDYLPGFTIIGLELPTQVATFQEAVEYLEKTITSPTYLLGWSLGGLLALALAHQYPGKIKGVILLNSTPKFLKETAWPGISRAEATAFQHAFQKTPENRLKTFKKNVCYPDNGALVTLLPLNTSYPWAFYLEVLLGSDLRTQYKTLRQPCLVLLGESDRILPTETAQALRKLNPQIDVRVLSTTGHMPFVFQTNVTASLILEFLYHANSHTEKL